MLRYLLRRLGGVAVTFVVMTALVFIAIRLLPGSTIDLMMETADVSSAGSEEAARAQLQAVLGHDQPVLTQYARWMGELVLRGDLGKSLWKHAPVNELIAARLPVTIELGLLAMIISLVVAIPAGIYAALNQDSTLDYALRWVAIVIMAKPTFWLATLIVVLPSIWWGWSPDLVYAPLFEDPLRNLYQTIVPASIMGMGLAALTMRMTRAMILEVLHQDFVRTARAKGLLERTIIVQHILRNALVPVITLIGLEAPLIFGGAVIMEQIFSLPGIGLLMLEAVAQRDYPVVSGVFLVIGSAVLVINLMVDVAYGLLDPRIRYV